MGFPSGLEGKFFLNDLCIRARLSRDFLDPLQIEDAREHP